jgi:hypothetical protein
MSEFVKDVNDASFEQDVLGSDKHPKSTKPNSPATPNRPGTGDGNFERTSDRPDFVHGTFPSLQSHLNCCAEADPSQRRKN